jgi:hypothetical protein
MESIALIENRPDSGSMSQIAMLRQMTLRGHRYRPPIHWWASILQEETPLLSRLLAGGVACAPWARGRRMDLDLATNAGFSQRSREQSRCQSCRLHCRARRGEQYIDRERSPKFC